MPISTLEDIGTAQTYTTPQMWENDIPADISADDTYVGQGLGEAHTTIQIQGHITSAANHIEFKAKSGHEHDGRAHEVSGAGNARIEWANALNGFEFNDRFIEASWLELKGPGDQERSGAYVRNINEAGWVTLHHNILHNNNASTKSQMGIRLEDAVITHRAYRNIVYGHGTIGLFLNNAAAGSKAYYNTVWDNNHSDDGARSGIDCRENDWAVEGNAVFDNSQKDFINNTGILDYNADSDGSHTEGANRLNSLTSTDELTNPTTTFADTDLTIKAGANLIGEGNDPLSGTYTDFPEINYPISDRNTAITVTWDIGADQIVAAPPAGAIMNQLQQSNLGADLFNGTLL